MKKTKPQKPAPKPPQDPWDGLGWIRYVNDWQSDWPSPGGLSYDVFRHRFVRSIVPKGWFKQDYGEAGKRADIGRGHAAFLDLFVSGALDSLESGNISFPAGYLIRTAVALHKKDEHFFPDLDQAFQMYWSGGRLTTDKYNHEFMVLAVILEESEIGSVSKVVKRVNARFGAGAITYRKADKVVARLKALTP